MAPQILVRHRCRNLPHGIGPGADEEAQRRRSHERRHGLERSRSVFGRRGALGHPTPNMDRVAKEGATFTSWYGQASCTAGRASFITGRIPIRSALSIVVAPGDENSLRKETPTIAEFFKKNGYSTYFSGKWHLGDKPEAYPIEHGFDDDAGVRRVLSGRLHVQRHERVVPPLVPVIQPGILEGRTSSVVNMYEWEGDAGQARAARARRSPGTTSRSSTCARRTRPSSTSSSTPTTASPSSWTSTS